MVYHHSTRPPSVEGVCDQCGGRVVQREDDKQEAVQPRIEIYLKKTIPVLDGKTWNHPAFSDGRLLVRNLKQMAVFDLRR